MAVNTIVRHSENDWQMLKTYITLKIVCFTFIIFKVLKNLPKNDKNLVLNSKNYYKFQLIRASNSAFGTYLDNLTKV